MCAHFKIPNLDEKQYDVGYKYDDDILPFYDTFEDEENHYF